MENGIDMIENKEITTAEEWKNATQDIESDNHDQTYPVQLLYWNTHIDSSLDPRKNGYLMVTDEGNVCSNGNKNDSRTLFDIVHDVLTDRYRLICKGGDCKGYILYMIGHDLKAKKWKIKDSVKDTSVFFNFRSKHNNDKPPWKISSYSGVPLQFNSNGNFLTEKPGNDTTDYTDPYYFIPFTAHTMHISAV
ncbi:uncharacterized protein LOC143063883 [Mytilus galloprovincialis]|uniref:uncharacterized protein LOC143063883 n=1 Tax=Mytilus galloprovincialis TaxID=29158 RepID=UPI003F7B9E2B